MHDSLEFIDQSNDRLFKTPVTADSSDLPMKVSIQLGDDRATILNGFVDPEHALSEPFENLDVRLGELGHRELRCERFESEPHREDLIEVSDAHMADQIANALARPNEAQACQPLQRLSRGCTAHGVVSSHSQLRQ